MSTQVTWTQNDRSTKPLTFEVSIRTRLKAHCEIDDIEVGRGATKARVLTGSTTCFTRFMTWPAYTSLIWEASGRAPTDTRAKLKINNHISENLFDFKPYFNSLVQSILFAGDTLSWSTTIASLLITFRITVVQHYQFIIGVSHNVFALRGWYIVAVEGCISVLDIGTGTGEKVLIINKAIEILTEIICADRGLREVGFRRRNIRVGGYGRTSTGVDVRFQSNWIDLSSIKD